MILGACITLAAFTFLLRPEVLNWLRSTLGHSYNLDNLVIRHHYSVAIIIFFIGVWVGIRGWNIYQRYETPLVALPAPRASPSKDVASSQKSRIIQTLQVGEKKFVLTPDGIEPLSE
jgi:hypothetical protein